MSTDPTFLYRVSAGLTLFLFLGLWDWYKHPDNPRRFREYAYLFGMTGLVMLYGIVHDLISYTISPAYYSVGKGLAGATEQFHPEVTLLALKASWTAGLIGSATLLFVNTLGKKSPPLPIKSLIVLALIPWLLSILMEIVGGFLGALVASVYEQHPQIGIYYTAGGIRFFIVWGMHFGLYLGGLLGLIITASIILRKRIALRHTMNAS